MPRYWTKHFVAGFVHLTAFVFLLAFAARDNSLASYKDKFWYESDKWSWGPHKWKYACDCDANCTDGSGNLEGSANLEECNACPARVSDCPDSDKRFFVDPPADATFINAIALACVYVAWSSVGHFIVWHFNAYHREIKWIDYVVTAPVMLVVLGLSYGADNAFAIVLAPVLLAVLLVIAGIIERREDDPVIDLKDTRAFVIYGTLAFYILTVAPVLYAANRITVQTPTDSSQPNIGYGAAPKFVFWFAFITVLLFSSFAFLYVYDGFVRPLAWREAGYITLSMISKTTLHLFIGLSVIETARTVSVGEASSSTASDMDTLGIGLGGSAALIIGLTILNFQPWVPLYDDSVKTFSVDHHLLHTM